MIINVIVKTGKKESKVIATDNKSFTVLVKSQPKEDKANKELLFLLSDYFNIPYSRIIIKKGKKSHQKIIVIEN